MSAPRVASDAELKRIVDAAVKMPPVDGGWHYPELHPAQIIAISVGFGFLAWVVGKAIIR